MKYLILLSIVFIAACASQPHEPTKPVPDSAEERMKRGVKAMEIGDYSGAAEEFDHLLVQNPASDFDLIAMYNDGTAHVALSECKRGAELYRHAAHAAAAIKIKRIEAESLYQLSLAYECMGDDRRTVAALLDAHKRAIDLTPDVGQCELPARMAAAYARLGQRDRALQYFREASNGLKRALALAGTTNRVRQQFAARTLYAMGQLTTKQKGLNSDASAFLKSLSMQQPYLLQSAEMAIQPESRKAADELIFAYENMLKLKPENQLQAKAFLELALQNIAEIKKIRLPGKGPIVDEIYDRVEAQEMRVREMLTAQSEMPLTEDAERREGVKRTGRTVGKTPLDQGTQ